MGIPTAKNIGIKKLVDKSNKLHGFAKWSTDGSGWIGSSDHRSWRKSWRRSLWWPRLDASTSERTSTHIYTVHVQRHDSCKCKCAQHGEASFWEYIFILYIEKYVCFTHSLMFMFFCSEMSGCIPVMLQEKDGEAHAKIKDLPISM